MGKRVSIRQKRREAPEWVFPWRPLGGSRFPGTFAVLLVGALFALLLSSVRIRVTPPAPWAARKASVIHTLQDEESRALTLRAREGGPFPSRFDPAGWDGAVAIERAAFDTARWSPPPHAPVLRDLPQDEDLPLKPAAPGEAVFPKRAPGSRPAPAATDLRPVPTLYPLSGITRAGMPDTLPPFEGGPDPAEGWNRFLIRLDASGHVTDCVSLAGGDENGPSPLEAWLRRVTFQPEPTKPARWIAVEVGFANPLPDGNNAR